MSSSTTKKAILRRYDKESLAGYLNPVSFLQPAGVELLSAEGRISTIPYLDIKSIAFVRDFTQPAAAERQVFQTRPKMEGLWVRLRFRDGDILEGVMPNNLLQIEALRVFRRSARFLQQPAARLRPARVAPGRGGSGRGRQPPQTQSQTRRKDQIGLFEE